MCFFLQGISITSMSSSTSHHTRSVLTWASRPLLCFSHNIQTSSVIKHGRMSSRSSLEALVRFSWVCLFFSICVHLCVHLSFSFCLTISYFCFTFSEQSAHRPSFHKYGLAGHQPPSRCCHGGTSLPQSKAHTSCTNEETQASAEEAQQESCTARKKEQLYVVWWFVWLWWLVWLRRNGHHCWGPSTAVQKHPRSKRVFFQERYGYFHSHVYSQVMLFQQNRKLRQE